MYSYSLKSCSLKSEPPGQGLCLASPVSDQSWLASAMPTLQDG